jgi:transcriptional antiterminator RfaH
MFWYLIQTKPRSENVALVNLSNQGYKCYLPKMKVEKVLNKKIEIKKVPLFPRYLFINLDLNFESKSWAPIRSTRGVSNLVRFGQIPAKIHDDLVQYIYIRENLSESEVQPLFQQGQSLKIINGPFSGFDSIYQGMDSEMRVMVLLEFMQNPLQIKLELNQLKLGS